MRMHKAVVVLLLAIGLPASAEAAGVTPGDSIDMVVSDPVLTGYDINDPNVGQKGFFDNTQTAAYFVGSGSSDFILAWGNTGTGTAVGAAPGTSSGILFTNSGVVGADFANTPFKIGDFGFWNGTSTGASLIFGATISFLDHQTGTPLGSDQLIITTTNNLGFSQSQDADYINICGAGSNVCSTSVSAYEKQDAQAGNGITFDLYGIIVGDPQLILTGVTLTGGDGELGNQLPLGMAAVPEPSTWAMMIIGFAALGFMACRRKQNGSALSAA